MRRWRAIAKLGNLRLKTFCEISGFPIIYLESKAASHQGPSVYFSAGIHGDEPAASEALITWTEKNLPVLKKIRPMIFPCLNPWGIVNNSRFDQEGRDLNRCYNESDVPQIAAQCAILRGSRFALALLLHEDYDAHGIYIYELTNRRPFLGEKILKNGSRHIPIDSRRLIEHRPARKGVIRQEVAPDLRPDWPEAFLLHFHHADRTFTIETPSEFHIEARVAALMSAITTAVNELIAGEFK